MQASDLIAFEQEIAATFNRGEIKAPVHMAGGNEQQLIDIFDDIGPADWVLCSWRSHYHALLKGVPAEEVREAILAGRSIALCFPQWRILSSAIVGGTCPIAVGLGWAIKAKGAGETVHVFLGDMTVETGIFHECIKYCTGHRLPVRFIVEDNHRSVCTNTGKVWGRSKPPVTHDRYEYDLTWPHVGTGTFVRF